MSVPREKLIEKEQRQEFWRRIFRRIFLEDWGTKLIALAISIALWLGVTGLRSPTTIRLKNVVLNTRASNDMEITNTPPQEVEIVVTGDKRLTDRINSRDLVVSVDLTEVKPGDQVVALNPDTVNVDLPNGVKLEEIQPNKISVKLERVEEREIEVKTDLDGNLPEDLEIYSVTVVPSKVRIRGAESIVREIDSVYTEPINLDNRTESFAASQIGLSVINPKITLLDTIVDVNFRIGEKRLERVLSVPVKTEGENVEKTASVIVFGARSIIEKLKANEMHVEIETLANGASVPRLVLPPEMQTRVEIRNIKLPL